ncbi:MAG: hypothetical protein SGI92_25205 [Bryobacteraceae bacterium]|nr:hypothetical protein [Bryobacteraceae bacterium]
MNSWATPSMRTAVIAAPLNGAEEYAAKPVSDRGAETTLEGLRRELTKAFSQSLGVGDQAFRFLEPFEHGAFSP